MTREYFEDAWDAWLAGRSRLRKWQPLSVGVLFVASLMALFADFRVTAAVLAVMAVMQAVDFRWNRHRWIAERVAARAGRDPQVRIVFDDEGLTQEAPTTSGRLPWAGIAKFAVTPGGLSLGVGAGVSVFVPRVSVSPADAYDEIVRRLECRPS